MASYRSLAYVAHIWIAYRERLTEVEIAPWFGGLAEIHGIVW